MLDSPILPARLEAHGIDDTVFEHAYEAVGAENRAALKHGIAVLHAYWGEREASRLRTRVFRQGFCVEEEDAPAPYALLVCSAAYAHPARLLAALMPAVLAGVPLILPCFVPEAEGAERHLSAQVVAAGLSPAKGVLFGDEPANYLPAAPLLAALELSGVEGAYALAEEDPLEALEYLRDSRGRGRVLLLGPVAAADALLVRAARLGVPCMTFLDEPLHRDEEADLASPDSSGPFPALDEALDRLWIWPELSPDWFRNRRLRLSAAEED